jgi:hypothetical protein
MAWTVMYDVMQWVDANGDPASGYVIKAYEPGTTTPISIAIDKNGGSPQATITLNAEGKPEVSGNEVMLFIDRDYKWAVFRNASDAAANSNPYAGFYDSIPQSNSASSVGYNSVSTVGQRLDNLDVADYTALRAITSAQLIDGDSITVTDDGIGGIFIIKTGTVTDNGGTLIVPSDDSNRYFERIWSGDLSVDWFGAKGDNNTLSASSNVTAIQAALDYAFSLSDPFPVVFFGHGRYYINGILDRSGNGNYVDIKGMGRRNTSIYATGSTFNSIFNLAESGEVTGRTNITDMTIDCNSVANYAIDAEYMRYWTLENTEIRNAIIAGAWVGNWVVRIINNTFEGCPIGLYIKPLPTNPTAANNLIIEKNSITDCPIGLEVDNFVNDIVISQNSFDVCEDAGIYLKYGGRKVDIKDNYFERAGRGLSGNGTGVTVTTGASTSEDIAGAIVIGYDYTALVNSLWSGSIVDNFFANVNTDQAIVLYNVEDGRIEHNSFSELYSVSKLVNLRQEGCSSSLGKKLVIKGAYSSGTVSQLVELNGTDPEANHHNLVIDNQSTSSTNLPKFYANDPTASSFSGSTTINTANYGGFKEFEYDAVADAGTPDKTLLIDFTTLADHPLLGRYVRVHYATKGSSSSTAIRCRISVSGSTILDIQGGSTTYEERGRGMTVYIPSNATSFEIRTDALSSSNNSKVIGFCVCDASYDIHEVPIAIT